MTLSTRVLSAVCLLGLLLASVLAANFVPAWRQYNQAQARLGLNLTSSALVEAAGALAVERGMTNGVLAAPASGTPVIQAKIAESRAKATAALAQGLASAPGGIDPRVAEALARLDALRREADRGAGTPAAWFAAATATIDAVVTQRRRIDRAASDLSEATAFIALRDQLAE